MAVVTRPNGTKVPDIRKGDTVVVILGKDAGKSGVVERVIRNQQGWAKTKSRGGGSWRHASPVSEVGRGRRRGEHRQAPHQAPAAQQHVRPDARAARPAGSSRSPSPCRWAR